MSWVSNMVEIAICDDERVFVRKLKNIISGCLDNKQIEYEIDCYSSGEELSELGINMSQYNILFLDIEMGSMNGIETAKLLRKYCSDSYIVLVTAFAKYSIEGYSVDTTRYILKNDPHFVKAIEESLTAILDKMKVDTKLYKFDFRECSKKICLNKIAYIESIGHDLVFHIIENGYKEYTIRASLKTYDEMFSDKGFIRAQQSYLVNWRYIDCIKNYIIYMKDDTKIGVSKKHYKEIKQKYIELKGEL